MSMFAVLLATSLAAQLPVAARGAGACLSHTSSAGLDTAAYARVGARFEALFAEAGDFNELRLDRAELGGCVVHDSGAGLLLGVEAIRSAGPDSLIGVDGDSIVVRLEYAVGYYRAALGPGVLRVQAGLVPDAWVHTLERHYDLRSTAPLLSETARFYETSDLGVTLAYAVLDGRLSLEVAYGNGEGAAEVEQNTGKNLTVVLSGAPLVLEILGAPLTIGLHASLRDGSLGVAEVRNHRLAGAITAVHPRLRAGAELVHARGYRGRGDVEALGLGVWLAGTLVDPWLGVSTRLDLLEADLDASDAGVTTTTLGLYTDAVSQLAPSAPLRLRLHAAWQHTSRGAAAPPVPGAALDTDRLALVLEASAFVGDLSADLE
jgi:hypothetical protein